jgi:hypothetical protein
LRQFLYNNSYDIILVTETWLKGTLPDGLLDPNNQYMVSRCDRQTVSGGVCAFIRKPLVATEVTLSVRFAEFELCCFEMKCCRVVVRFIVVYRPSDCRQVESLIDCVQDLINTKHPCIIMGDLNCPDANWDSLLSPCDKIQDVILDFTVANGLSQLVTEPTRGDNILDVVICNEPLMICHPEVIQPFSNSALCQVEFKVFIEDCYATSDQATVPSLKRYDWSTANFERIVQHLATINWHDIITVNLTAD